MSLLTKVGGSAITKVGGSAKSKVSANSQLLFEWHAESATVTSGTPAGSSVGDTTATATGAVSLSATQAYDGTTSLKVSGANNNYAFDWVKTPAIVNPNAGTLEFRIYFTTIGDQMIFEFQADASNRIYAGIDSAGYLYFRSTYGGTASLSRTAVGILSTGQWYYAKCRWDTTPHNGCYINVSCDTTNGEGNSAYNGTDPLGIFAGSTGTVKFGDTLGATGVYYLDAIKIYNTWQVQTETYYADPSASASTEDGTTAQPYKSAQAAMVAKCNRPFLNPIQILCRTSSSTADLVRLNDFSLGQMVTTASCFLSIANDTGHRAGKTWDDTKYHLTPAFIPGSGTGTAVAMNHNYVRIDGLQLGISSIAGQSSEAAELVYLSLASTGWVSNCLIKGSNVNNSGANNILRGISSINGINVYNTIIDVRTSHTGNQAVKNHGASFLYNCTVLGGLGIGVDVANASTVVAKNTYMQGGTSSFAVVDVGSLTQTTCATSDALSTTGSLRNVAVNTTNFTNVTTSTEDWSLPVISALKGTGTDNSSDTAPFNYTTDIEGTTRVVPLSIGATV